MLSGKVEKFNDDIYKAAADPINGFERVKKLIEINQVDFNLPHPELKKTPVEYAAESGDIETIKFLIETKKANIVAIEGKNLLYYALHNKNLNIAIYVSKLIDQFTDGTTSVHAAAAVGNLEIKNPDYNYQSLVNKKRETPLYYAALAGNMKVIDFLMQHASFQSATDPNKYGLLKNGLRKRINILLNHIQSDTLSEVSANLYDAMTLLNTLPQLTDEDHTLLVECYQTLGKTEAKNKDYEKALSNFMKGIQAGNQISDARVQAQCLVTLYDHCANFYFDGGYLEEGNNMMEAKLDYEKWLEAFQANILAETEAKSASAPKESLKRVRSRTFGSFFDEFKKETDPPLRPRSSTFSPKQ